MDFFSRYPNTGQFTWQNTEGLDNLTNTEVQNQETEHNAGRNLPPIQSLQECHLMHYQNHYWGQQGTFWGQKPTGRVPSLRAQTGFAARQTCFLTALMYQCIA